MIWHDYMSGVTEGHPCAALHEDNTGISFKPFYGKYASTGSAQLAGEEAHEGKPHGAHKHGAGRSPATPNSTHAPAGPPPPARHEAPSAPPPVNQTRRRRAGLTGAPAPRAATPGAGTLVV